MLYNEGKPLVIPKDRSQPEELHQKDMKALELIRQKVDRGEKVLIYTSWVRIDRRDDMAAIDLIVLGMLKKEPMGAYDIQKLVEYRNISKWVKISTELLGNAPVSKSLMALGVPIMIGMTINALYNLADAYFVGGLGEGPMGAISIVFPLGQVIVGLGLMFGSVRQCCSLSH